MLPMAPYPILIKPFHSSKSSLQDYPNSQRTSPSLQSSTHVLGHNGTISPIRNEDVHSQIRKNRDMKSGYLEKYTDYRQDSMKKILAKKSNDAEIKSYCRVIPVHAVAQSAGQYTTRDILDNNCITSEQFTRPQMVIGHSNTPAYTTRLDISVASERPYVEQNLTDKKYSDFLEKHQLNNNVRDTSKAGTIERRRVRHGHSNSLADISKKIDNLIQMHNEILQGNFNFFENENEVSDFTANKFSTTPEKNHRLLENKLTCKPGELNFERVKSETPIKQASTRNSISHLDNYTPPQREVINKGKMGSNNTILEVSSNKSSAVTMKSQAEINRSQATGNQIDKHIKSNVEPKNLFMSQSVKNPKPPALLENYCQLYKPGEELSDSVELFPNSTSNYAQKDFNSTKIKERLAALDKKVEEKKGMEKFMNDNKSDIIRFGNSGLECKPSEETVVSKIFKIRKDLGIDLKGLIEYLYEFSSKTIDSIKKEDIESKLMHSEALQQDHVSRNEAGPKSQEIDLPRSRGIESKIENLRELSKNIESQRKKEEGSVKAKAANSYGPLVNVPLDSSKVIEELDNFYKEITNETERNRSLKSERKKENMLSLIAQNQLEVKKSLEEFKKETQLRENRANVKPETVSRGKLDAASKGKLDAASKAKPETTSKAKPEAASKAKPETASKAKPETVSKKPETNFKVSKQIPDPVEELRNKPHDKFTKKEEYFNLPSNHQSPAFFTDSKLYENSKRAIGPDDDPVPGKVQIESKKNMDLPRKIENDITVNSKLRPNSTDNGKGGNSLHKNTVPRVQNYEIQYQSSKVSGFDNSFKDPFFSSNLSENNEENFLGTPPKFSSRVNLSSIYDNDLRSLIQQNENLADFDFEEKKLSTNPDPERLLGQESLEAFETGGSFENRKNYVEKEKRSKNEKLEEKKVESARTELEREGDSQQGNTFRTSDAILRSFLNTPSIYDPLTSTRSLDYDQMMTTGKTNEYRKKESTNGESFEKSQQIVMDSLSGIYEKVVNQSSEVEISRIVQNDVKKELGSIYENILSNASQDGHYTAKTPELRDDIGKIKKEDDNTFEYSQAQDVESFEKLEKERREGPIYKMEANAKEDFQEENSSKGSSFSGLDAIESKGLIVEEHSNIEPSGERPESESKARVELIKKLPNPVYQDEVEINSSRKIEEQQSMAEEQQSRNEEQQSRKEEQPNRKEEPQSRKDEPQSRKEERQSRIEVHRPPFILDNNKGNIVTQGPSNDHVAPNSSIIQQELRFSSDLEVKIPTEKDRRQVPGLGEQALEKINEISSKEIAFPKENDKKADTERSREFDSPIKKGNRESRPSFLDYHRESLKRSIDKKVDDQIQDTGLLIYSEVNKETEKNDENDDRYSTPTRKEPEANPSREEAARGSLSFMKFRESIMKEKDDSSPLSASSNQLSSIKKSKSQVYGKKVSFNEDLTPTKLNPGRISSSSGSTVGILKESSHSEITVAETKPPLGKRRKEKMLNKDSQNLKILSFYLVSFADYYSKKAPSRDSMTGE